MNEVNLSAAAQGGYVANAEGHHPDDTLNNEALQTAINNFAQASAADRDAFLQLTATNSMLQAQNTALQSQITYLQQQVKMIHLAQGHQPPQHRRPPPTCAPPRPYQPPPPAWLSSTGSTRYMLLHFCPRYCCCPGYACG